MASAVQVPSRPKMHPDSASVTGMAACGHRHEAVK